MSVERSRSSIWIVVAIVAVGAILRLWGIGFGLPYEYHVDEDQYVRPAASMAATQLKPAIWNNPPLYKYILLAEYSVLFIVGRMVGAFHSVGHFAESLRLDPTWMYLLARATSALMGAATVWVTFATGRKAYNSTVGVIAAFFFAVAFLPVREAHFAVNDAAAGLCVSLVVLASIDILQTGSRRGYVLAGAFLGLGFATKYHTLAAALPLAVAHFQAPGVAFRKPSLTKPLLACAALVLCAIAASPYFVLAPREVWPDILALVVHAQTGFVGWQIDPAGGYVFYLKTLAWGLGWGLCVFTIAGVAAALIRHRAEDLTLVSLPVALYAFMGMQEMYFGRFLYPIIPALCILAAVVIHDGASKLFSSPPAQRYAVTFVSIALAWQPVTSSIRFDTLLTRTDTRTIAKQWIEANIPPSRIAMDWPFHCPQLSTDIKPRPDSRRTYELWQSELKQGKGLYDHDLDWYRNNGYQYLVSCSSIREIPLRDPAENHARQKFVSSLPSKLTLVQEFKPYSDDTPPPFIFDEIYGPAVSLWERDRPGPSISIYRLD